MSQTVLCTCSSHCSTYDPQTGKYHGGQYINRSTAYLHRRDDNRSTDLNRFATCVASSVLEGSSLLGLPYSAQGSSEFRVETQPQELLTLEREIRDRISWTPTRRPLVFVKDPAPDTVFENPLSAPQYILNAGICALDPSHPYNVAFIENESRLFEIRSHLEQSRIPQETCDELSDRVDIGQQRMMEHKGDEWNRQKLKGEAVARGLCVVDTGRYLMEYAPLDPVVNVTLLTVLLMHLIFHLSRRATGAPQETMRRIPDDPR
ncbi:hypothetical protein BJ322DRAFT_1016689 [Thelephora terrestris]|uniref:Uncharacterized protein n=1 Tax=Thelephora terrestris TaxID=56493 RepID=A0A9P6HR18_9AGAM|nr:hypothetical protein BJ322DRAFT_1016689 [Thelephora terrestris]